MDETGALTMRRGGYNQRFWFYILHRRGKFLHEERKEEKEYYHLSNHEIEKRRQGISSLISHPFDIDILSFLLPAARMHAHTLQLPYLISSHIAFNCRDQLIVLEETQARAGCKTESTTAFIRFS